MGEEAKTAQQEEIERKKRLQEKMAKLKEEQDKMEALKNTQLKSLLEGREEFLSVIFILSLAVKSNWWCTRPCLILDCALLGS